MKTVFGLLFLLSAQFITGQNSLQRAAESMNRKDWFSLQREYTANKDSLPPLLKDMGKALTDYYFNRLESAEVSISALLNNHADDLDEGNKLSMVYFLADCLHRLGKNKEAAGLMAGICSQLKAAQADDDLLGTYEHLRDQYRELSSLGTLNSLERPDIKIVLPLSVDTIETQKKTLQLNLNGTMNGKTARFLFDTGAGVNAATPQSARKYGMKMLDATTTATGINTGTGGMAIADSLRIGELLFRNVPFYVLDLATGNQEADKHLDDLELIIGIPVIEVLKEVQIDLANLTLTIPRQPTPNPFHESNLCFSDGRNLWSELTVSDDRLVMKFDTGASDILFFPEYYERNKEWVEKTGKLDSVRYAGFAGVEKDTVYIVNDLPAKVGPEAGVFTHATYCTGKAIFGEPGSDGVLGMDFFTAFPKVIINLKEMYIQAVGKPGNGLQTSLQDRSASPLPVSGKIPGN